MRPEGLVDNVMIDAIIYDSGGPLWGAFPGSLLSASYQIYPTVKLKLCSLFVDTYPKDELLVSTDRSDANINWVPT